MKTNIKQTMVLAAVLSTAAVFSKAAADQPQPVSGPEDWYTGQVVSMDPQNRTVDLKTWMMPKKQFSLGANCSYVMLGINNATPGDIRPGQKLTVRYFDSHGVRIVDRVEQQAMQYEGMVSAIDPNTHTLTLHKPGLDQTVVIADGCSVTLRDNNKSQMKSGVLTDIQPGDHVTVTYETPNGTPTARQIAQTSVEFTGRLTAIDLDTKIVKAKGTMETKEFNLADNCAIVINGNPKGKLSQLKPDDRLQFNYDNINGVNVVNRIAPVAEEPKASVSSSPTYPGYPTGY